MAMKQSASQSAEDAELATAGVWGCLIFFVLLAIAAGSLLALALLGGMN